MYPFKYSHYSRTFFLSIATLEGICLYIAFKMSFGDNFSATSETANTYSAFYAIWLLLWIIVSLCSNQYSTRKLKRTCSIVLNTTKTGLIHLLGVLVYLLATMSTSISVYDLFWVYLFSLLAIITSKLLMLSGYRVISNRPNNRVNYIVIGCPIATARLLTLLRPRKKFGHHFQGSFDLAGLSAEKTDAKFTEVTLFCQANHINQVYLVSRVDHSLAERLITYFNNNFIHFATVQNTAVAPPERSEVISQNHPSGARRGGFSGATEWSPVTKKVSNIL